MPPQFEDRSFEPVVPLPRDLRRASANLGIEEVRYLVDTYYQLQEFRKATMNQSRALTTSDEPHETIAFFGDQFHSLEKQIQSALNNYSANDPLGAWARNNIGIGPVIAAGLLAHIDIAKVRSAGQIWSFAGLNPEQEWKKGEKRPWNARLKVLCWKIGDSFVKNSNRDNCFYGKIYRERKAYEVERDLKVQEMNPSLHAYGFPEGTVEIRGRYFKDGNAQAAATVLSKKNIKDRATLDKYESGHLPDGQLDMRARRYAVKLFLAHYFEEGWRQKYGTDPPLPYPIAHMGHTHLIESPLRANHAA